MHLRLPLLQVPLAQGLIHQNSGTHRCIQRFDAPFHRDMDPCIGEPDSLLRKSVSFVSDEKTAGAKISLLVIGAALLQAGSIKPDSLLLKREKLP